MLLYLRAHAPKLLRQLRTLPGNVFEHHFQDQTGDRIEVAREGVTSEPERLQRNRSAAGEWIDDERRFFSVRRFHQSPAHFEIARISGKVPIREIADELENRFTQIDVFRSGFALNDL